jgi:hypothetical protein
MDSLLPGSRVSPLGDTAIQFRYPSDSGQLVCLAMQ